LQAFGSLRIRLAITDDAWTLNKLLLGQLRVFGNGASSFWTIAPLAILGAFTNAAWYMIVVEAIRLLLKRLSPS
jgi:hypothetical protein